MGTIEDVRKIFQDFIAPELREMSERFKVVNARFDAIEARLQNQEQIAAARHSEIKALIEGFKTSFELDKWIERLEAQQPSRQ